jgi:signal transduction histidine kinase
LGVDDPESLVDRSLLEFVDPSTVRAIHESGAAGPSVVAFEIERPDGRNRQIVVTGIPISFQGKPAIQGMARDVTEQRHAERERTRLRERLEESRRLESLGVLAGGIAHDFNNLLTVILGNARFAIRQLGDDPDTRLALDDALEAAESAARLTRQLLAYAGRREPEVRAVDLSAHTRSVSNLLRSAVPKAIDFEFDLCAEPPPVRADVVQLEQVIMNLVINGAEAIGDRPGVLRIATRVADVDEREVSRWVGCEQREPGCYVALEVTDCGRGMDEVTRSRIFDPFFTTKQTGHGLGLSAVLGLVRGHGGGIAIDSKLRQGTTIRVFLPRAPA